ncbi:MAG TPA: hypothetical protein VEA40_10570 [Ramlibacter sp.]|nr:hypothetical protein [Ramlibacter sp.]
MKALRNPLLAASLAVLSCSALAQATAIAKWGPVIGKAGVVAD